MGARRSLYGHVLSQRRADRLVLVRWPATQPTSDWGTSGVLVGLLLFVPFLAFPIVGALIASRRPTNPIGWICLAAGLFWMLIVFGESIPSSVAFPVVIDALMQWTWVPPVGLLG